ncbi:ribosomal protein S8 (apicoplast) [Theileria orientalis]|uniref:Ribosomal protein S8 n=1 Tax=Theileria orientalis TaxID=68886 RepID=A0A976SK04_THEOR|nr:ribosomal protein S8 [Theileria orientalis]
MKIHKIPYNKLNNMLYNKLNSINCIKDLKHIKLNNKKNNIIYNKSLKYLKILNKPTTYFKLNYKELIKTVKKLKSGYLILSTPFGLLTDRKAIIHKTGGVVLCYVR